jgi:hypothetical protein
MAIILRGVLGVVRKFNGGPIFMFLQVSKLNGFEKIISYQPPSVRKRSVEMSFSTTFFEQVESSRFDSE